MTRTTFMKEWTENTYQALLNRESVQLNEDELDTIHMWIEKERWLGVDYIEEESILVRLVEMLLAHAYTKEGKR